MVLSKPGPIWYNVSIVSHVNTSGTLWTLSCRVYDAGNQIHNGLALDGVTVQSLLDIQIDTSVSANITGSIEAAVWNLMVKEYGSVAALLTAIESISGTDGGRVIIGGVK